MRKVKDMMKCIELDEKGWSEVCVCGCETRCDLKFLRIGLFVDSAEWKWSYGRLCDELAKSDEFVLSLSESNELILPLLVAKVSIYEHENESIFIFYCISHCSVFTMNASVICTAFILHCSRAAADIRINQNFQTGRCYFYALFPYRTKTTHFMLLFPNRMNSFFRFWGTSVSAIVISAKRARITGLL